MKKYFVIVFLLIAVNAHAQEIQDARGVTSDAVGRQDLPHLSSGDISNGSTERARCGLRTLLECGGGVGEGRIDSARPTRATLGNDSTLVALYPPVAPSAKFATWAVIAGNAADLGTTIQVIGFNGGHEMNPLLGSKLATIIPLKIALTAWQVYSVRKLSREGHPNAAKVLGALIGGFSFSLAVHNESVIR